MKNIPRPLNEHAQLEDGTEYNTIPSIHVAIPHRPPAEEPPNEPKRPPVEELEPVMPEPLAKVDESIEKVTRKANFTRREWVIIGSLIALLIIVLIALIGLIVFTL